MTRSELLLSFCASTLKMAQSTPFLNDSVKFMFGFSACLSIFSGIELYSTLQLKRNVTNIIAWMCITSSFVQSLICTSFYVGWIEMNPATINYSLVNWFFMTQSLPHLILNRYLFLSVNKYPKIWYHACLLLITFPVHIALTCIGNLIFTGRHYEYIPALQQTEYVHVIQFFLVDIFLNKIFLRKFQDVYLRQHKDMSREIKRKIIIPLVCICISDLILVFTEIFVNDLYTTCIRGLIYSVKTYFEIAIVRLIIDTIKAKHSISVSTKPDVSSKNTKSSPGSTVKSVPALKS